MACLLDTMCPIIGVFDKHAKQRRGCSALTRREMKTLLQEEFAGVIENPHDPETLELTFQQLDVNEDSLVDFNEYLFLIFRVAKACDSHLQPRERYVQRGEARRARHEDELREEGRDHRQLREAGREEGYVCERRDFDHPRLHPEEAAARREGRRDHFPQEPVARSDQRSRPARDQELRDDCRRHHRSRETREWEDECEDRPRGSDEYEEVETCHQTCEFESRRDEAGHHQLRQREPPREEDHQCQSRERDYDQRDCLPRGPLPRGGGDRRRYSQEATQRGEDERRRQPRVTECQMEEEEDLRRPRVSGRQVDEESHTRQYAAQGIRSDYGRSRPSSGPWDREDGRREDYAREDEWRSSGRGQRVADARWDQRSERKPVDCDDECHLFPRGGERRSLSCDPEHEQRRSQRCGAEHTERSMSDCRVDERRSQSHYRPQSRGVELREHDVRESERRRRQTVDQDEWTRPCPREATTRAELEDQRWSRILACRWHQRTGLHPSECQPTDGERRRPQPCEYEPREVDQRRSQRHAEMPEEGDWRRDQCHQDEPQEEENLTRRRPLSGDIEPCDHESCRPQRRAQEPRGSQRRQQYYDPEPLDRDVERRMPEAQEAARREGSQGRQQRYNSETLESRRNRPQSCYSESWEGERRRSEQADFRDDERERPQVRQSLSRPREEDRYYPAEGGQRECDRGRRQEYESEARESQRRPRQLREPEGYEARRQRDWEPVAREQEGNRPQQSRDTDPISVDGRRSQTREVDPREQQRRVRCHDPEQGDSERRQTLTFDDEARQGNQRRNWSRDTDRRGDEPQRRTQLCADDVGDVEPRQRGMDPRISEPQRRAPSRSSGTADTNQRRLQACEDEPREGRRRRAVPPGLEHGASQQRRPYRCSSESRERDFLEPEERSCESRVGNRCVSKPRLTQSRAFSCN